MAATFVQTRRLLYNSLQSVDITTQGHIMQRAPRFLWIDGAAVILALIAISASGAKAEEAAKENSPVLRAPVSKELRLVDFVQRDDLTGICAIEVSPDGKSL